MVSLVRYVIMVFRDKGRLNHIFELVSKLQQESDYS